MNLRSAANYDNASFCTHKTLLSPYMHMVPLSCILHPCFRNRRLKYTRVNLIRLVSTARTTITVVSVSPPFVRSIIIFNRKSTLQLRYLMLDYLDREVCEMKIQLNSKSENGGTFAASDSSNASIVRTMKNLWWEFERIHFVTGGDRGFPIFKISCLDFNIYRSLELLLLLVEWYVRVTKFFNGK